MSRGLGTRQRMVLAALRGLDGRRPGRWWSPAELIGALMPAVRVAVPPSVPEVGPEERMILSQLKGCRDLVAMGHRDYAAGVVLAERRLAELRAVREAGARARAEVEARRERQRAAMRPANQRRPTVRGGEEWNPARVLATLARRGLVERAAFRGPGSVVRVVTAGRRVGQ